MLKTSIYILNIIGNILLHRQGDSLKYFVLLLAHMLAASHIRGRRITQFFAAITDLPGCARLSFKTGLGYRPALRLILRNEESHGQMITNYGVNTQSRLALCLNSYWVF